MIFISVNLEQTFMNIYQYSSIALILTDILYFLEIYNEIFVSGFLWNFRYVSNCILAPTA